jgi:hypothetical protein
MEIQDRDWYREETRRKEQLDWDEKTGGDIHPERLGAGIGGLTWSCPRSPHSWHRTTRGRRRDPYPVRTIVSRSSTRQRLHRWQ